MYMYMFGKNQLESCWGGGWGRSGALTFYSHGFMDSVSPFLWYYISSLFARYISIIHGEPLLYNEGIWKSTGSTRAQGHHSSSSPAK